MPVGWNLVQCQSAISCCMGMAGACMSMRHCMGVRINRMGMRHRMAVRIDPMCMLRRGVGMACGAACLFSLVEILVRGIDTDRYAPAPPSNPASAK